MAGRGSTIFPSSGKLDPKRSVPTHAEWIVILKSLKERVMTPHSPAIAARAHAEGSVWRRSAPAISGQREYLKISIKLDKFTTFFDK